MQWDLVSYACLHKVWGILEACGAVDVVEVWESVVGKYFEATTGKVGSRSWRGITLYV